MRYDHTGQLDNISIAKVQLAARRRRKQCIQFGCANAAAIIDMADIDQVPLSGIKSSPSLVEIGNRKLTTMKDESVGAAQSGEMVVAAVTVKHVCAVITGDVVVKV